MNGPVPNWSVIFLPIECKLVRLGGHVHGLVTKSVHKTITEGLRGYWDLGIAGLGVV